MSRSFRRELVLRSPPRVILGEQVGSPGTVVIVAAAAFLSNLVETRPRRLKRFPVMLYALSRKFAVLFNLRVEEAVDGLGYGIRRMLTALKTRNELRYYKLKCVTPINNAFILNSA